MATCREIITSEDYFDYIVETTEEGIEEAQQNPEVCFKVVNDTWSIRYAKPQPGSVFSVGNLGYYTIPKLYGLMDTTSFDSSGITSTINQPSLNVRGQGVLIGFVDTGIDYLIDSFKFSPTASKILTIWDQSVELPTGSIGDGVDSIDSAQGDQRTIQSIKGELQNEFDYGTIYTEEDINRALQARENNDNPYAIVSSSDTSGHGTFMAGVAAASRTDTYIGAAPDARIAMVKLKPAKKYLRDFYLINEQAEAYQENDIMMGVHYLQKVALELNYPLVICLGIGTSSGSSTGSSPLANYLSDVARQGNTVVVLPVGNEANARAHVMGTVASETEPVEIEVSVGSNEKGFTIEIWADSLDVLSVSFVSPSGEQIPRIPARIGPSSEFKFLLENTQVSVDYKVAEKTTGYEVVFIRFINPSEGIWKVNVYSLTNIKGGFNAWLPIKQFLSGDTYFLNSTPNSTLTGPSDAIIPISIGAYDHITGGIYIDSGRGYTPDNRIKPDIVAPGVNVYGPKNGGGFTNRTGTSIAAAHVAGAAALLLTWGVFYQNSPLMGTSEVKTILIRGAERDNQLTYPNNIWGYGKLNLLSSFLQMRIT